VEHFVRSQALGKIVEARAQWHNKTSWKFVYPTKERENELNWRLSKENCAGLLGEVGIHQIDTTSWYLRERPIAVTGYSANLLYEDGRTTADTVQCVVEYPGKVRMLYDATLTNSFDAAYETFIGTDAAVMLRDQRAWMFKEADAGQLGWEVFARKDDMIIGDVASGSGVKLGTGIALVADATKQLALGKQPGTVGTDVTKTSLYQAIEGFLKSCQKGERVPAKEATKTDAKPPLVPGAEEGYEATVVAIKANEAAVTGSRVAFQPEWFTL
jgi:predicted dehydrogenase